MMEQPCWLDLSVVTDPRVAEALASLLTEWRMRKRWDNFPPLHRRLHRTILRTYLDIARAPTRAELAVGFPGDIDAALADLAERDLVVPVGGEIAGAYPFTSRPSRHSVTIAGREIATMCAIDAMGAGAMAGQNAHVRSACAQCDTAVEIAVAARGLAIGAVVPETAVVWAGVKPVSGCAADTQCQSILLFCTPAHLEAWRAASAPGGRGYALTPDQALQAGAAIFRPFIADASEDSE